MRIQPRSRLRSDGSRRRPANNCVSLGQGDGNPISTGEGEGSLRNQLQHFVEDKLLQLPNVRTQRLATLLSSAPLAYLFVQAGKCKQGLQSLVSMGVRGQRRRRRCS